MKGDLLKRTISFMTGKGSLNHNSRKFHAKNTDPNRTHWNVEYCNENIKDVYHELFDEALKRYNDKQTRKDRKIDDYYEKIRSGKQEKLFHEVILQIGDKDNMGSETMEGQLAAKILDEYMKGFQERNPTLRVFAAHLHLDEATPHLHIDFIPYVTGSKRGLDTRVSLKQALSSLGFKGGSRSETELNQWVQSEKQKLAMVMRENEIEWDQKGTHEQHLSVLDYKKKVREQEVEELTEHKNLLEHDLHDISECVDEIQKEKAQAEKERDAVIKKTEVLEKRFSALNSKAGLVDSHAREYGYYPEEWLPEAGTLESAKSYRKRIFPLVKKVANMIQALYSKYLDLKNKNQKLSDRNIDLENRVDRLREEISVIKKENVALLNVAYDMDRVVAVLGENKVKEAIEVAKHLEQVNAKQKGKKRRTDREGR
jgi:predicted nuclease with TOPRIM domain